MKQIQQEYYDGATEIQSDPIGLLDRDNRNHRKKLQIITDYTAATPGDRVLEVGCGHGVHAREYAKRYHYTGIDVSESLVEQTRRRVAKITDDYSATTGNAMDLEYKDNAFDAVVGTAILHHLHSPRKALREWQRVASGSVTLMEPNYLFPKEFVSTHFSKHERHKINMRPWRIRSIVDDATPDGAQWSVEPRIYTAPWPNALFDVYNRIDSIATRIPAARWLSQMLLIHIEQYDKE